MPQSLRSARVAAAGVLALVALLLTGTSTLSPAQAAGPVYAVMNTSEYPPDGVYFRSGPNWDNTDRLNGWGVYAGDRVRLNCSANGSNVPRRDGRSNTVWYQADNVTRPSVPGRANSGWINAHFVDDGTGPNQIAPGVPACGGGTQPAPAPVPERAPVVFGARCAAVTMLVLPGSGETNSNNSPDLQTGVLQKVTNQFPFPAYGSARLRVHYVPYPSQILGLNGGVSYNWSKDQGYGAAWQAMKTYADTCRDTRFILVGYSQGAHVAGDLTATIGKEASPIPSSRLIATALLGDAARQPQFRPLVGMNYSGGHGIRGSRGDFGGATPKVTEYCAAHDPVCDYAGNGSAGRALVEAFRSGPHKTYDRAFVPGTTTTYTDRIASDLRRLF